MPVKVVIGIKQVNHRTGFVYPADAVSILPDSLRYENRFTIMSDSGYTYTVSQDTARKIEPGLNAWVCSCPAGKFRGTCKHLRKLGLQGQTKGTAKATVDRYDPILTEIVNGRNAIYRITLNGKKVYFKTREAAQNALNSNGLDKKANLTICFPPEPEYEAYKAAYKPPETTLDRIEKANAQKEGEVDLSGVFDAIEIGTLV